MALSKKTQRLILDLSRGLTVWSRMAGESEMRVALCEAQSVFDDCAHVLAYHRHAYRVAAHALEETRQKVRSLLCPSI
jgi:hypothetical protein